MNELKKIVPGEKYFCRKEGVFRNLIYIGKAYNAKDFEFADVTGEVIILSEDELCTLGQFSPLLF